MKGKVLFVRAAEYSSPPRIPKQAKTLISSGYSVEVLCWDINKEFPESEVKDNYVVSRFHGRYTKRKWMLFFYMLFWWAHELRYILRNNFEIIHASDFEGLPPAIIAKLLKGTKIVYDIRDSFAEKFLGIPSILRKFIRLCDIISMIFVDAILICDEKRIGYLRTIPKFKPVEIIMNVPEIEYIEYVEEEGESSTSKPELLINLCGYMHPSRGIYQICEAVKGLKGVTLDIIGHCDDESILQYIAQIENVRYHGKVNHLCALKMMSKSDLVVALYQPDIIAYRYPNSNKVFEAMLYRKAILTNYGTSLGDFVENNKLGYVVDYYDIQTIRYVIKNMLSDKSFLAYGENGFRLFKSAYNWDVMKDRLLRIYKAL